MPETIKLKLPIWINYIKSLNKSEFDLIAVGRALLSDPEWANKVQNGQEKDIIPFDKSFVENYV